jgi:hypothetical protein
MVRNGEAGILRYPLIKLRIHRFIQIVNPSALFTSEVVVVILPRLESTYGAIEVQLRNYTCIP